MPAFSRFPWLLAVALLLALGPWLHGAGAGLTEAGRTVVVAGDAPDIAFPGATVDTCDAVGANAGAPATPRSCCCGGCGCTGSTTTATCACGRPDREPPPPPLEPPSPKQPAAAAGPAPRIARPLTEPPPLRRSLALTAAKASGLRIGLLPARSRQEALSVWRF